MRVIADRDRCVAGGQCVLAAPDVFDQEDDDGTVIVLQAQPAVDQERSVQRAARLCPASAITVLS
jgi:ferredoxin